MGGVWEGGLPHPSFVGPGVTPGKFLKTQVQICVIWCTFGEQCNGKCTTQCLIPILGDQFDDTRSSKVAQKIHAFPFHF